VSFRSNELKDNDQFRCHWAQFTKNREKLRGLKTAHEIHKKARVRRVLQKWVLLDIGFCFQVVNPQIRFISSISRMANLSPLRRIHCGQVGCTHLTNKLRIKASHNSISEGEFFLFDYRLFTDSLEHYLYKSLLFNAFKTAKRRVTEENSNCDWKNSNLACLVLLATSWSTKYTSH
jgi:hypothetical protein